MKKFTSDEFSRDMPSLESQKAWTEAITGADLGYVRSLLEEPYNIDPDMPIMESGMAPLVWLLTNDKNKSLHARQALIMNELIQAGAELHIPYIPPGQKPADLAMITANQAGAAVVVGNTLISEMKAGAKEPYSSPLRRIFTLASGELYRHECFTKFKDNHEKIRDSLQKVLIEDEDLKGLSKSNLSEFWKKSLPEINENDLPQPSEKTMLLKQEFLEGTKQEWLSSKEDSFDKWEKHRRGQIFISQIHDLRKLKGPTPKKP